MSIIMLGMSSHIFTQFGPHDHATWEIVLNIQGSGYTIIGQNKYDFAPGTIICQPPNTPHSKFSKEGFKDVYWQPTFFSLSGMVDEYNPLIFQDDAEKTFETLIIIAHRAYHEKRDNHLLFVESILESMNQLLISWLDNIPEDKDIRHLKKIIIESFTNPEFTIAKLLDNSPYSDDHLRRRFKRSTGQTPGEYLTNLRIEYAKKLMSENRMLRYTIAEIGVMSGYYDSHYFSRIFKKKTSMSPTDFLNKVNPDHATPKYTGTIP